jgi:hypothetical protein
MSKAIVVATITKNRRETLRVALDSYQGHDLLDVRVCVPLAAHAQTLTPTKAGVSVRLGLLPELIAALRQAEEKARELGLLDG